MTIKIVSLASLLSAAEADPLNHFFDPDTMRYFKARNLDAMPIDDDNGYFVGSKRPPHGPRIYEVRRYYRNPATGRLDFSTPDDFDTAAKARAHARQLVATYNH